MKTRNTHFNHPKEARTTEGSLVGDLLRWNRTKRQVREREAHMTAERLQSKNLSDPHVYKRVYCRLTNGSACPSDVSVY